MCGTPGLRTKQTLRVKKKVNTKRIPFKLVIISNGDLAEAFDAKGDSTEVWDATTRCASKTEVWGVH